MIVRPAGPTRARAGARVRLDHLVVSRGLAPTRHQAETAIRLGEIFVDGERRDKPGALVAPASEVQRRGHGPAYVSRGGLKLAGALDAFGIDPAGVVAIDVGASTGGFTDCLLQRGARRVYAVDVGHGVLHWQLRRDPRVVVMERRHAAQITPGDLPEPADLATIDVSFISLLKVLPAVARVVRPDGVIVALVKPQFEAGPKAAPKGVVRDPRVHIEVLRRVIAGAARMGVTPAAIAASPLIGPRGNREFFVMLRNTTLPAADVLNVTAKMDEAARIAVSGTEAAP
jgi:23S rRNA (cytidine1920-2'-O)/16S rRNA (cytidine1409-2'-O)-methyltransferase